MQVHNPPQRKNERYLSFKVAKSAKSDPIKSDMLSDFTVLQYRLICVLQVLGERTAMFFELGYPNLDTQVDNMGDKGDIQTKKYQPGQGW